MRSHARWRPWAGLVAGSAALTASAHAESNYVTALIGSMSATAHLDFVVTIPRVLYLRVGTGTDDASAGAVDLVSFTVPAGSMGNGTPVVATGGDLGAGAVTVRVRGNGGDITLNSNTSGPLHNGIAARQIGWNRITVTPAPLPTTTNGFTNGVITHPAFNGAGGPGSAVLLTSAGNRVQREGKWTYGYANVDVLAAGTYGGAGVNNGRVTYTAVMP
ncbi:hypothetical protein WKW79_09900 [Variovorax robiniae]|uniref:Uncharacterized protein n=1 Tax=Variovorax robiniae TaxID=1836199 RepID=A0ABU8X5A0_9BURK